MSTENPSRLKARKPQPGSPTEQPAPETSTGEQSRRLDRDVSDRQRNCFNCQRDCLSQKRAGDDERRFTFRGDMDFGAISPVRAGARPSGSESSAARSSASQSAAS